MGTLDGVVHPPSDAPIVAFDFDGTLTCRDSFMAFLRWRAGPVQFVSGMARLAPAFAAYITDRNRARLKMAATRAFLGGLTAAELRASADTFAQTQAATLLRPDAMRRWRDWQGRVARLVVVTASPEIIVAPFARELGAERTIGTRLTLDDAGRITGAFDGANCRGAEKVKRLEAAFGKGVRLTAAYGDSAGDTEMLGIADEGGYRVFTEKP